MKEILEPVKELISLYNTAMVITGEPEVNLKILTAVSLGQGKKPNHLIVRTPQCSDSSGAVKTYKLNTIYLFTEDYEKLNTIEKENIIKNIYHTLHKSALTHGFIFVKNNSRLSLQSII